MKKGKSGANGNATASATATTCAHWFSNCATPASTLPQPSIVFALRVQMRPGATGRPDELVDALGFDDYARTLRRERIYFSDCEEDQALFATYPVISQDEISPERPRPRRKGRKRRRRSGAQPKADKQTNQPFAQKAADEFD